MNSGGAGDAFLSLTRDETREKARIFLEMKGGAKTLHGIAHRSWLDVEQTADLISQMMTEGWFKLTTTPDGRNIVTPAEPGEQLVDPDLYSGIISAVRSGATSVAEIADWLDMPADVTLHFAVGVSLRIAKGWRRRG